MSQSLNLNAIFRPNIIELEAYSSARSLQSAVTSRSRKTEVELESQLSLLTPKSEVFLDANESALPPYIESQISWDKLRTYPMPQPKDLVSQFASFYNINADNIVIGRGSDEAIDLLTRATCEPNSKDCILITSPTYGMYKVSADIQGVRTLDVPLVQTENTWTLNVESIKKTLASKKTKVKLVYLCSPNNPTGDLLSIEDIKSIAMDAPEHTLVVVDEAYAEFTNQSAIGLIQEFQNIVILRTLSKAWALAGLRCGSLIADPSVISVMQKVRAPYPLAQPVVELAVMATTSIGQKEMAQRVKVINEERENLKSELLSLPNVKKIYDSQANFLLVQFDNSAKVMEKTLSFGIVLRHRTSEVKNCVRITVGTKKQNTLLIDVLKK